VDSAADIVTENLAEGTDLVLSSVSYTLADNVENLTLTGTGAIDGSGNALDNVIQGNAGNNVLAGDAGIDTISYSGAAAAVTVTLASALQQDTVGAGLDTLSGFENLTGSAFNDTLTGDAGKNVITGLAGNDTLDGGAGSDSLTGGAGADVFVFDSKVGTDNITDFVSGTDKLAFSQAGIRIGDGDTVIDGFATVAGPGGFAASDELVIVNGKFSGAIDATSAAAAIGSATSAYTVGDTRLFAVENGTDTGLFLFTSSGADATVSAAELTLVGVATSAHATVPGDFAFVA
jgi:Ca2+-binding RTX toxin-like protein